MAIWLYGYMAKWFKAGSREHGAWGMDILTCNL
jgi:hypothetical protein